MLLNQPPQQHKCFVCCLITIEIIISICLFSFSGLAAYNDIHKYDNYVQTNEVLINNTNTTELSPYNVFITDDCNFIDDTSYLLTCEELNGNPSLLANYDKQNCMNIFCMNYMTQCTHTCSSNICTNKTIDCDDAMRTEMNCVPTYGDTYTQYNCPYVMSTAYELCASHCRDFYCRSIGYHCPKFCTRYGFIGCRIARTWRPYYFTIRYGYIANGFTFNTTDYISGECQMTTNGTLHDVRSGTVDMNCVTEFYNSYNLRTIYYDRDMPANYKINIDNDVERPAIAMLVTGIIFLIVSIVTFIGYRKCKNNL
jgi:hypothetical protein